MSKWKNNKVDECFVKDSTNARMAFINTFKGVLWYCATLSHDIGYTLSDIAKINYEEIHSHQVRGKLHGNGDNR